MGSARRGPLGANGSCSRQEVSKDPISSERPLNRQGVSVSASPAPASPLRVRDSRPPYRRLRGMMVDTPSTPSTGRGCGPLRPAFHRPHRLRHRFQRLLLIRLGPLSVLSPDFFEIFLAAVIALRAREPKDRQPGARARARRPRLAYLSGAQARRQARFAASQQYVALNRVIPTRVERNRRALGALLHQDGASAAPGQRPGQRTPQAERGKLPHQFFKARARWCHGVEQERNPSGEESPGF